MMCLLSGLFDLRAASKAIVMVGLDGSGKTCILRQLIDQKPGILRPTTPTLGISRLKMPSIGSSD